MTTVRPSPHNLSPQPGEHQPKLPPNATTSPRVAAAVTEPLRADVANGITARGDLTGVTIQGGGKVHIDGGIHLHSPTPIRLAMLTGVLVVLAAAAVLAAANTVTNLAGPLGD